MKSKQSEITETDLLPLGTQGAIVGPIAAHIAFVMELTLVPLLLPAIQSQLGLSVGELAWIFNSYGVAVAIGVLIGGLCGDTFNTRAVFGYGVIFFVAGSLVVAVAGTYETLVVGRTFQGLGGGIFSPLVPLLLTRSSSQKPGKVLIVWGSLAGYVAAFAPLVYSRFIDDLGWNFAFIFIATIAIIALTILTGSQDRSERVPQSWRLADYSQLFRSRKLWQVYAYVFCTYGAITYYLFRLPVWLSENEIATAGVGLMLTTLWLTFSGLSTLLRNMVDKPFIRPILVAAPFLVVAGFALSHHNGNQVFLLLSAVLVGAGLACSNAPSTQLILRFAPAGTSAVSTSLDITFARAGGIAAVAILAETGLTVAATTICLLSVIAVFCVLSAIKGLSHPA